MVISSKIRVLVSVGFGLVVIATGCGKGKQKDNAPEVGPSAETAEGEQPLESQEPQVPGVTKTPEVSEFLHTNSSRLQRVRKDHAQVLLVNENGDVAVAGVTRSLVVREDISEPALGGDLFFTRYSIGKGWSEQPVQVAVEVPLAMISPPPPPPEVAPELRPFAEPLIAVKGGRLMENGKALVVGELKATRFSSAQLNLEETKNAEQAIFLSIFGSNNNGMMKSVRYGLSGVNTVVATASSGTANTFLMAGETESGLRKNVVGQTPAETAVRSNYLAEVDDEGELIRFHSWPATFPDETTENVRALAFNGTHAFVAFERKGKVLVRGIRIPVRNNSFIEMPEKEVCADAALGANRMRVASIDVTETELVVAVEFSDLSVSNGVSLPCFEVFDIKQSGTIVAKREIVNLKELPTISGTTRVNFVGGDRLLVTRSRENTDSRGSGVAIVTFLYERPLTRTGYESWLWGLGRPEWYGSATVDSLERIVKTVFWSKIKGADTVWILSEDRTMIDEEEESLVHLGTYRSVPGAEQKQGGKP